MDCPTCGARNDDRIQVLWGPVVRKLQEQASIPGNREPIDREPPPETGPAYNPYSAPEPIDQEPPPQTAPETAPGYSPYRGPDTFPARIPNYLIPAILVTLFCCVSFRHHCHRLRCSGEWQSRLGRHRRSITNIPKREEMGVGLLRHGIVDNRRVGNIHRRLVLPVQTWVGLSES